MPSSNQSFKYLYGQAFRAPNEYELNTFYFGEATASLRPESIDTHELVWERYTNDWLRTSVSAYWYKADGLITLVARSVDVPGHDLRERTGTCGRRGWSSKRRCASVPGFRDW